MTRAREVLRITESAIALPKIRRGEVLIMHVDDFARLQPAPPGKSSRAGLRDQTLTPQAIRELAPLLRQWVNGLPNTVLSERETARDYDGRVIYTTAGEANNVWRLRAPDAKRGILSVYGMGQLLSACGFKPRVVNGVDGLKVRRYHTPPYLLDPR